MMGGRSGSYPIGGGAQTIAGTLGVSTTTDAYHNMGKQVLQRVYRIGQKLYFSGVPERVVRCA